MSRFPPHYGVEDEPDPERQQELADLAAEYRRDEQIMRTKNEQTETLALVPAPQPPAEVPAVRQPTSLDILDAAVRGGVTSENVAVVKEIVAMRREEIAEQAKIAFAKAFFALRKDMPEIYADKAVKDDSGKTICVYASEKEISEKLNPHLLRHGFTTLVGQSESGGRVTISITLVHEAGHSETRDFTVRSLTPNRAMDGSKCDAGAATLAWRHLTMKMFGLKSHFSDEDDPRILGSKITAAQSEELQRRVKETNSDERAFLKVAGVGTVTEPIELRHYAQIQAGQYEMLDELLQRKESRGR